MKNKTKNMGSEPTAGAEAGYVLGFRDEHGFGVFATRAFEAGEAVMLGRDELRMASHQAALARAASSAVGLIGNVNHSCKPNCGIRVNALGARDLVARSPIGPGAELTFDYRLAFGVDEPRPPLRCAVLALRATTLSPARS